MARPARRVLDYLIAGILLLVPAALLQASLKAPAHLNALDRAVLGIASPLQKAVAWVIGGVGHVVTRYVWLVDVDEENDELRRENARLHAELAEARRAAADWAELEALVGLRHRTPAETTGARVVAVGLSPYFRVSRVTLDRGEPEVQAGMPVLSPDGIVGRITRVYGRYADVQLAVDPQSSIDVVLPRTGSRGVLRGLQGEDAYGCRIDYVVRADEVRAGDLVVTSGLGGVFPRDVPVGTVRAVKKVDYGLYQEVEVEPAVDFARLGHVLVILAPPPPPDPTAKEKGAAKRGSSPAFGLTPR